MISTNLNYNENFSFTSILTNVTNDWYQQSKANDANYAKLFLGTICSRLVNCLILPAIHFDTISHLVVAIFTLGFAAPIGKLYDFVQWTQNSHLRSRFSFAGGIINLMNAKKHFNALHGTITGILNPEKGALFFDTREGRTKDDIEAIFKAEICYCDSIIESNKFSVKGESYKKIKAILQRNICNNNIPKIISLEKHEEFCLTHFLTTMTNNWYQRTYDQNANLKTHVIGSMGSRIVNLLILPGAMADSIINFAIGFFTLLIGAPLGFIYNSTKFCLKSPMNSRFTFAGGMINLMNAKNYLINAPFATFAGILNPEKAAFFFKTSQRMSKRASNEILKVAMMDLKNKNACQISNDPYQTMIGRLRGYLLS